MFWCPSYKYYFLFGRSTVKFKRPLFRHVVDLSCN
jgi:hypothetical protein